MLFKDDEVMTVDRRDIVIVMLMFLLVLCIVTIFSQRRDINILQSEIESNREVINTELHLIDSIYDNNYRLWDYRVEQLLKSFEEQGYLIQR
jgi:predicted Holliday junction resolvase-like endonuclease